MVKEQGERGEELVGAHGGYRHLRSFQLAYDVTVRFCDRYIDPRSRTHDQMVQAARSDVQNIAEGSKASATSRKSELKLMNVARASLEELRLDFEDFLRQRGLAEWERDDPRCATADEVALWVKEVYQREDGPDGPDGHNGPEGQQPPSIRSIKSIRSMKSMSPKEAAYAALAANAALVLIGVAIALLDRQLAAQAATFEREGGFTERMYRVRQARRRGE